MFTFYFFFFLFLIIKMFWFQNNESTATKLAFERRKNKKRQYELDKKFIRDRPNLKPFPSGSLERLRNNHILEQVLEFVDSLTDICSAFKASPAFRSSLPEKNLMTKVFQILKDNKHLELVTSIFKENKDVLNLRLVSKSWKSAVETVFMNEFRGGNWHADFVRQFEWSVLTRYYKPTRSLGLSYSRQIDRAMTALQNTNAASVASFVRVVRINCFGEWPGFQDWYMKINRFFATYGEFVQCLHIFGNTSYENCFVNFVKQTPNLKALILSSCDVFFDGESFADVAHRSPFPTLQSLELIRFDFLNLEEPILIEILRNCPNLKSVYLPTQQTISNALSQVLNNLRNVEHYVLKGVIWHPLPEDEQIGWLSHSSWPLKSISLKGSICCIHIPELFLLLQRFDKTLEDLELHLTADLTCRDHQSLNLPHLKRLRIVGYNYSRSLDFLSGLHSLEYLELDLFTVESPSTNKQFGRMKGKLKGNSIWKYLTQLKTIRMRFYDYKSDKIVISRTEMRPIIRLSWCKSVYKILMRILKATFNLFLRDFLIM